MRRFVLLALVAWPLAARGEPLEDAAIGQRAGPVVYQFGSVGAAWPTSIAPTISCVAGAAGALTCTGATATQAGTPTTVSSPYRPAGFSGADPQAVRLNGSADGYTLSEALQPTGDFSGCAKFATDTIAAGSGIIAGKYSFAAGGRGWMLYRSTATLVLQVYETDAATTTHSIGTLAAGAWNVACFSYDYVASGSSIIRSNLNGGAPAETVNAVGPVQTNAGVATRIGVTANDASWWSGAFAEIRLYLGTTFSAAELDAMVRSQQARRGVTVSRAAPQHFEVDGTSYWAPSNTLAIESGGAAIYGSYWQEALNTEDASAWSDYGAGGSTVATNTWTGRGWATATGDEITDTGANTQGRYFATPAAAAGVWTASCTLERCAASPANVARLYIYSDASGTLACPVTLPAVGASARYSCTTTIGAGPTALSASILVGAAAADTGCIRVLGCNLTQTAVLMPYVAAGASRVQQPATVASVANPIAGPMPFCVSATMTAPWSTTLSPGTFAMGLGVTNSIMGRLNSNGDLIATLYDAAGGAKNWYFAVAAGERVTGTRHGAAYCYGHNGIGRLAWDGVELAITASGAGTGLLGAIPTTIAVGVDYSGNYLNGNIERIAICPGATDPRACP